jgi:hypothetical protein
MKAPFAYVLYIDRGTEEHLVSLYQSLDEAEDALRDYAGTIFVGGDDDDDIVKVLADYGSQTRIFACTLKRGQQISTELNPFARTTKAA